jgi:type I restriction enzyme, S subunit
VKLGDVCEVVRGSSPRPKGDSRYYGGAVPRLMVADLTRDGKIVSAKIDSLTELGAKQSRSMCAEEIVVAVSGAPGLPAILAHDVCIHDGFVGLRKLDKTRVDIDFLYAYLTFVRSQNHSQAVGAIFKNLTTHQVRDIEIPEIPVAEQKRIAAILDKAEELRELRRQALGELDAIGQSVFLEMFGEPEKYGWAESKVESLVSAKSNAIRTGPFGSQLLHSEFVDSGIAVLGIDNAVSNKFVWARPRFITEQKYQQLKRYTVFSGDVIITIMGTCGRCAVVPEGIPTAINTKHLCCITLDQNQCSPNYLQACFLMHPKILRQLGIRERGAVMPGLNMQLIKELRIPLPPIELQQEFARRVEAIEQLKSTHRESLAHFNALFASLQHRAFRGEL